MNVYGIIPARLHSTRLPGKLLLDDTGKPLLQYAWEAAQRTSCFKEVIIAVDDERIGNAARAFGARVEMTGEHASGTDRIAEVVRRCCTDADLAINVQGDEPELNPESIEALANLMANRPDVEMGTLASPITSQAVLEDRSCVKVVCAADGRALYFSRLPIPCYRDGDPRDLLMPAGEQAATVRSPWLLHIGIYAYRPPFLLALTKMPRSRLEQLENLEQLRALEAGASILVKVVHHHCVGIDTSADYAAFVERQRSRASTEK